MNFNNWEKLFKEKILSNSLSEDPAHDLLHIKRVVSLSKKLCTLEKAKLEIVLPAAWFHDFVVVPKNSPLRNKASTLSAEKAIEQLNSMNYPSIYFSEIFHAIQSHSFSANIEAKTIEAKIIQDADRLDGLGAIGIARCFATAGVMNRSFYQSADPFCENRQPDDSQFTVDHFYKKLFKTAETLQTTFGILEGKRRLKLMQSYLDSLRDEIV